ncbi:MAG: flagellar motor switch protein FliG [Bryobacterales bacterium]|nr:flagellar motor switch protein FliG [Bryobacterales bacterium]
MITNAEKPTSMMPGIKKAAVLMVVVGDHAASEVLSRLTEDEASKLSREIARTSTVPPDLAEAVLEEAYQMSVAQEYVAQGGIDYARKLLISAYGPEAARRLLDRLMKAIGNDSESFDALQKADPQQLAKFIHKEHPQTIALVLSHLNSSHAAALLQSLPAEIRADVSLRMANLERISPEVVSRIAGIIGQKIRALGEFSRESYGGVRAVAEMFNRLDSGTSKEILDDIEKQDTTLTEAIRHLMFVFEDLLLLDGPGIKEVLARVDRKLLTVALKGTSEQLKQKFLDCMSQRGADMLREDMDALGPVKIKEVDAAQQQIIAVVRQLESEGVVSLKGAVGEQYVV